MPTPLLSGGAAVLGLGKGLDQTPQLRPERGLGEAKQAAEERCQQLFPPQPGQALAVLGPAGPQAVFLFVDLAQLDELAQPLPAALQAMLLLVQPAFLDELVNAVGAFAPRLGVAVWRPGAVGACRRDLGRGLGHAVLGLDDPFLFGHV